MCVCVLYYTIYMSIINYLIVRKVRENNTLIITYYYNFNEVMTKIFKKNAGNSYQLNKKVGVNRSIFRISI